MEPDDLTTDDDLRAHDPLAGAKGVDEEPDAFDEASEELSAALDLDHADPVKPDRAGDRRRPR